MATDKKYYSFTKTKAREIIEATFENGNFKTADAKNFFDALMAQFEAKAGFGGGNRTTGSNELKDADGKVIGAKCSLTGKWFKIEDFGVRGGKRSYRAKQTESAVRRFEKELMAQLLNEEITAAEYNEAKADMANLITVEGGADTAEELAEALA